MRLSKIDDTLQIYKDKNIYIWGASTAGNYIYDLLQSFGFDIIAFIDKDENKRGNLLFGKKIISPEDLRLNVTEKTLVQIGSTYEKEIKNELEEMQIPEYIYYTEAKFRLMNLRRYVTFKDDKELLSYYLHEQYILRHRGSFCAWDDILEHPWVEDEQCILLCLPPKTGDYTIMETLKSQDVFYINFWHRTTYYTNYLKHYLKKQRVKIITAVREPITQNLSLFFQSLNEMYWDNPNYWINGGDVNKLFAQYIQDAISYETSSEMSTESMVKIYRDNDLGSWLIQNFFEREFVEKLGIDIYAYPFDKENGYTIIRTESYEIFIYQLEKLNSLKDELFSFLGLECDELVNSNEAKDSWYFEYYNEAKNEIELSKEYFEYCFENPCIKHFYSEKDIESFKNKWIEHVNQ